LLRRWRILRRADHSCLTVYDLEASTTGRPKPEFGALYTLYTLCSLSIKKKLHEKLNWMFSGTAQVSHQVCQFFW
jgi:hypothetical protein